MSNKEPNITINGCPLTQAEAMTVRVALENFAIQLDEEGLGGDETGKLICAGYLRAITNIRKHMRKEN